MKKLLFISLLFLAACSKHSEAPNPPSDTTYITGISTFIVNEPGGGKSLGITYTVVTQIPSLQLIRDIDGKLLEAHTEVVIGNHTTYDRNNYHPGAAYHFLINNRESIKFIAP